MNGVVHFFIEVILWILFIYFTIYCLREYIDGSNIYYAMCLHLALVFLTILIYPSLP